MTDQFDSIFGNPLHSRDKLSDEVERLNSEIDTLSKDCQNKEQQLANLYNERGYMKYLQVEFTGAVKDFTSALDLQPSLVTAFYNRGLIHYRLARFDKAIQDMESALQLQPEFESAQLCLQQAQLDKDSKS